MMIIMRSEATQSQIAAVVTRVEESGLRAHISRGEERTIIGAIGDGRPVNQDAFVLLPGVDRVVPISRPYKLASREFIPQDSTFPLDGMQIKPGEVIEVNKTHSFAPVTTRKYYPGEHVIEVQINGKRFGRLEFELI